MIAKFRQRIHTQQTKVHREGLFALVLQKKVVLCRAVLSFGRIHEEWARVHAAAVSPRANCWFPGARYGVQRARRIADFAIVLRRADTPCRARVSGNLQGNSLDGVPAGDLCTVSSRAGFALNTFSIGDPAENTRALRRPINAAADRITKRTMRNDLPSASALPWYARVCARSRSGQLTLARVVISRRIRRHGLERIMEYQPRAWPRMQINLYNRSAAAGFVNARRVESFSPCASCTVQFYGVKYDRISMLS